MPVPATFGEWWAMNRAAWGRENDAIRRVLHAEAQANVTAEFERRKRTNGEYWCERIRFEKLTRKA